MASFLAKNWVLGHPKLEESGGGGAGTQLLFQTWCMGEVGWGWAAREEGRSNENKIECRRMGYGLRATGHGHSGRRWRILKCYGWQKVFDNLADGSYFSSTLVQSDLLELDISNIFQIFRTFVNCIWTCKLCLDLMKPFSGEVLCLVCADCAKWPKLGCTSMSGLWGPKVAAILSWIKIYRLFFADPRLKWARDQHQMGESPDPDRPCMPTSVLGHHHHNICRHHVIILSHHHHHQMAGSWSVPLLYSIFALNCIDLS